MWSKVKQFLRAVAARTTQSLMDAITDAMTAIRVSDCIGFFRHCGYAI
jgi:hypothetical protein